MSHAEVLHYINTKPRNAGARPRLRPVSKTETATVAPELDREAETHDKMLLQLREIIAGPESQLNESRYEEFINILAEQKQSTDTLFATFDHNFRASMSQSQAHFAELDQSLAKLATKVDAEDHATRRSLAQAIDKLREEQMGALRKLTLATEQHLKEVENQFRRETTELSEKFAEYAQESSKKREDDKSQCFAVFEQGMAVLRAEFMDLHQRDFAEVGNSVMEIGRKLVDRARV